MDQLIVNIKKWTNINKYFELVIVIIGILGLFGGMHFIIKELFSDDSKRIGFVYIGYLIMLFGVICYYIKKCTLKNCLMRDGKIIKAKFSKEEFRFGLNRYYNKYYIVAYYVDGIRTYRFTCEVLDSSSTGLNIFNEIKLRGIFPDISVLVEKDNYNNYEIQIYDFLNETLEMNREIVDTFRYS